MVQSRVLVDAPPITPPRFGLFSAALVLDMDNGPWAMGVQASVSEPCIGTVEATVGPCWPGFDDAKTAHDPADDDYADLYGIGDPITVYALEVCRPVGAIQSVEARARRVLELGAQVGVEKGLAALFAAESTGVDVTPTPGTAVTPAVGLALLEGAAGSAYAGAPTIHVPRQVASLLAGGNAIGREGTRMETKLGGIVAAGGGYAALHGPSDDAPGTGEHWMWATGTVVLRRGPIFSPGTPLHDYADDAPTNDFYGLAEQMYVPLIDTCLFAAVLVNGTPS